MTSLIKSIVNKSRGRYPKLVFQLFSAPKNYPDSIRNALMWKGIKVPSKSHLLVEIRDGFDPYNRVEFFHNQSSLFQGISNRQLENLSEDPESQTREWLFTLDLNSLPSDVTDPSLDHVIRARKHLETTLGWIENLPGKPGTQIRTAKELVEIGATGSYLRNTKSSNIPIPGLVFLPPPKQTTRRASSR